MKIKLLSAAAVVALAVAGGAIAAGDPMVGGAPMYATKNIIQNAVNSKDHTTLVSSHILSEISESRSDPEDGRASRSSPDQKACDRAANQVRRSPYCGAPTPTPEPSRSR